MTSRCARTRARECHPEALAVGIQTLINPLKELIL